MVTLLQLQTIMPRAKNLAVLAPHLDTAMAEADIVTPLRAATFLAQLAHESGELRWMEELASGAAYEGRKDLGNIHKGDGVKFKGRGPIQLTGRKNYTDAAAALGLDLVGHPDLVATPEVGFRTAAWFWRTRGLNALADAKKFDAITRRINGGYNGKRERDAYYSVAVKVLGA
jgi:putative chitinase